MKGILVTDLETFKIDQFLKKNLTFTHRQKVCMAPIMTNDSILDASKHSKIVWFLMRGTLTEELK